MLLPFSFIVPEHSKYECGAKVNDYNYFEAYKYFKDYEYHSILRYSKDYCICMDTDDFTFEVIKKSDLYNYYNRTSTIALLTLFADRSELLSDDIDLSEAHINMAYNVGGYIDIDNHSMLFSGGIIVVGNTLYYSVFSDWQCFIYDSGKFYLFVYRRGTYRNSYVLYEIHNSKIVWRDGNRDLYNCIDNLVGNKEEFYDFIDVWDVTKKDLIFLAKIYKPLKRFIALGG